MSFEGKRYSVAANDHEWRNFPEEAQRLSFGRNAVQYCSELMNHDMSAFASANFDERELFLAVRSRVCSRAASFRDDATERARSSINQASATLHASPCDRDAIATLLQAMRGDVKNAGMVMPDDRDKFARFSFDVLSDEFPKCDESHLTYLTKLVAGLRANTSPTKRTVNDYAGDLLPIVENRANELTSARKAREDAEEERANEIKAATLDAEKNSPAYWTRKLLFAELQLVEAINRWQTLRREGFAERARDLVGPQIREREIALCAVFGDMKSRLASGDQDIAIRDARKKIAYERGDSEAEGFSDIIKKYRSRSIANCSLIAP